MNIESKFDLNQEVFIIHDNKIQHWKIRRIRFPTIDLPNDVETTTSPIVYAFGKDIIRIHDYLRVEGQYKAIIEVEEHKVFKTKEELLNTL
jgi:hypothetical protein